MFRDPSPWRWADFTAHPRALTVGDRTGVKIIDTQVREWGLSGPSIGSEQIHRVGTGMGALPWGRKSCRGGAADLGLWEDPPGFSLQGPPGCGLLLFRGGAEASCQKGERVMLTQYLGECGPNSLQPTVHLICTQVSNTLPLLSLVHGY